jgi:hypothetical protein
MDLMGIRVDAVRRPWRTARGKVGGVKQRLVAEFDTFKVTAFDRCVKRGSANTEQVKCLADRISCLRKTENAGSIGPAIVSLSESSDTAPFVELCSRDLRG